MESVVVESEGDVAADAVLASRQPDSLGVTDKEAQLVTLQEKMAYRLRAKAGPWTNVAVKFEDDFFAFFLNHFRIAANRGCAMGIPVVKHVAEVTFVA